MPKRKRKKTKSRFLSLGHLLGSLLGLLILGFFYIRPYVVAPNPNAIPDMTELPPEMRHVLGSKTDKDSTSSNALRIPILMYHYVEYVQDPNDKIRISLNIIPSVFEEQIKTMQDAGYTFLTASDLDNIMDKKATLPRKAVLLTFDDGYRDFYEDAYPILKKYHVKATQYVIAGFLDRPNHMYTTQLQEIAKDNLVEIGAHTMDHMWLRGGDTKTVNYEVAESRKKLQSLTGLPITSFAYPYGAFDAQAIQIVRDAGFTNALSTISGNEVLDENRYFLYRLRPGWRTDKS